MAPTLRGSGVARDLRAARSGNPERHKERWEPVLRCACCHTEVCVVEGSTRPRHLLTCNICEQVADGDRTRIKGRDLARDEIETCRRRVNSIRFARRLRDALDAGLTVEARR